MANVLFYDNTIQIDHLSSRSKKGATTVFKPKLLDWITSKQTKNFTYHKTIKKLFPKLKQNHLTAEIIGKKD
jgi:hypothetical protein